MFQVFKDFQGLELKSWKLILNIGSKIYSLATETSAKVHQIHQ